MNSSKFNEGDIVYHIRKAKILKVYHEPPNKPYYQIKILKRLILNNRKK